VDGKPVPSLRALARCPARIDDIVRRAASPDPHVRQASCRVLARELEACLVSQGLVVSDDDVGKYMLAVFADRFEQREASLISAANVTEVFDREELLAHLADAEPSTLHVPVRRPSMDDTETPEATLALARSSERFAEPSTARAAVTQVRPVRPAAGSREGSAPFLLATPPAGSFALPLVERKQARRGFDELPTTRWDSPLESAPATEPTLSPRRFEDDDFGDELTQAYAGPAAPGSPSYDVEVGDGDDEGDDEGAQPTTRVLGGEDPASAIAFELTRMGEPPVPPPELARGFPTMPMRAPSLSAVLRAHERPRARSSVPPLVFVGIGAAAVFALFGYLRWRATRAAADEATVFTDTPAAPSTAAAPKATTDPAASPWVPVTPPPRASAASPAPTASATSPPSPPPPAPPPPSIPTVKPEQLHHVPPPRPSPPPATPVPAAPSGKTGLLTVVCTPACDDVRDGSRSLGPSPVFKVPVTPGSHKITMRTTDPRVEKVQTVVVTEGETSVVRKSMEVDPFAN
jgi:hypothetical protein